METPVFSKPRCTDCTSYVDNRIKSSMVPRGCGRTLFPGERYCIYGPKAIRFRQSWNGSVYPACPRRYRHLRLHIYVRDMKLAYQSVLGWREQPLYPDPKEYIFRRSTTTDLTPKKLFRALHEGDTYDMLGYDVQEQDVLELDNGVTSDFLHLAAGRKWHKVHLDKDRMPDERINGFQVLAHSGFDLGHFYEGTKIAQAGCAGFIRGHFGPGKFIGRWVDGIRQPTKAVSDEIEKLMESLNGSVLKNYAAMEDYCRGRFWAALPNRHGMAINEYGFQIHGHSANYYLRCVRDTDAAYQGYLYCYPVAKCDGNAIG